MSLSKLQQYIIKQCFQNKQFKKTEFLRFYNLNKVNKEIALKDIGKSIDRLVVRDLAKSSGVKTAKRWYTKTVILTAKGRKVAQKLLSKQQKLPLKKDK